MISPEKNLADFYRKYKIKSSTRSPKCMIPVYLANDALKLCYQSVILC